jgi:hypothetical protein
MEFDVYWTATNAAERYVDTVQSASLPMVGGLATMTLPYGDVSGGKIRIQTQGTLNAGTWNTSGNVESSQYSRWITVAPMDCFVPYSVTKTAWLDAAHTVAAPAGAPIVSGTRVYFAYEVANASKLAAVEVAVTDDHKTDGPVCTVTVPASGSKTCYWDEVIAR